MGVKRELEAAKKELGLAKKTPAEAGKYLDACQKFIDNALTHHTTSKKKAQENFKRLESALEAVSKVVDTVPFDQDKALTALKKAETAADTTAKLNTQS